MRILIQQVGDRRYYSGNGGWTMAVADALGFPSTALAHTIARHMLSGEFRVMLHLPESGGLLDFDGGTGLANERAMV